MSEEFSESPNQAGTPENEDGLRVASEQRGWQALFHTPEKIESSQKLYEEAVMEQEKGSSIKFLQSRFNQIDKDKTDTLSVKELEDEANLLTPDIIKIGKGGIGLLNSGVNFNAFPERESLKNLTGIDNIPNVASNFDLIKSLSPDQVRETDPAGISKEDLKIYEKLFGVKEGLQILTDHFDRINTNPSNQKLSIEEVRELTKRPDLNHDAKISILRALTYLSTLKDHPDGFTKEELLDITKKTPKMPDLKWKLNIPQRDGKEKI